MSNQLVDEIIAFKDGKKVYIDGPLSKVFTQTLYDLYPKEVEDQTGLVLESQINLAIQQLSKFDEINKNNKELKEKAIGVLYTVDSEQAILEDLINISKNTQTLSNEQADNSAVIINTENSINLNNACLAIENYCLKNNINVFYSLNKYMKFKRN